MTVVYTSKGPVCDFIDQTKKSWVLLQCEQFTIGLILSIVGRKKCEFTHINRDPLKSGHLDKYDRLNLR